MAMDERTRTARIRMGDYRSKDGGGQAGAIDSGKRIIESEKPKRVGSG